MSSNLKRVPEESTRRGTFKSNSATADTVRELLSKHARHGWGTRVAERMATEEEEPLRVRDWLYDQMEGHSALTVSALAELARECPPQAVERIKEELFEGRHGGPSGVMAHIGRLSRSFGDLQISLDEFLGNGRLDREEIPEVRRRLARILHEASCALQRIDQEPGS